MPIYLSGSGPHMMEQPMAGGTSLTTDTTRLDTAYVSTGVWLGNTNSLATTDPFSEVISEGWIHMESGFRSPNTGSRPWVYCDNSSGSAVLAVRNKTGVGGTMQAEYWDGAAWVTIGDWENGGIATKFQLDIYFNFAVDGRIEVYQDKEQVGLFVGNLSHLTAGGLNRLRLGNPRAYGSEEAVHSQILVCDFPTLFAKVRQSLFTSAGALTDMTGSVASINGPIPDTLTTDALVSDAAGEISTFKAPARSIGANEVKAVVTTFNGQRAGSLSPNALRAILRIGGVNYAGSDKALGYGNRQFEQVFETNPATGLAWTPAEAGSADLEVGVESRSI